jgi:hypothetical protein
MNQFENQRAYRILSTPKEKGEIVIIDRGFENGHLWVYYGREDPKQDLSSKQAEKREGDYPVVIARMTEREKRTWSVEDWIRSEYQPNGLQIYKLEGKERY